MQSLIEVDEDLYTLKIYCKGKKKTVERKTKAQMYKNVIVLKK